MRRLSMICFLLTVSALLTMTPVHAARLTTWTAKIATLDLVAGRGATAAFLAPDGSSFAYVKGRELCLYSLKGEKGNCVGFENDVHIDLDTVRWSPDSTKLAFSEDFLITFRDSDIWVYDVETNTVKDMTPAENREIKLLSNDDPNIVYTVDMIPQWSSDSQSIYFLRYVFSQVGDARPDFYTVNVKDNTIEEVSSVETTFPFSIYGFALSPDESKIAYNLYTRGKEKDGNWFFDFATKEAKFAAAAVQETAPWAYQFSSDGNLLLVIGIDTKGGLLGQRKPETSPIYTLPVSGGRQQQLNNDTYVFSAGWGSEGSELAYTTFDQLNPDKEGLYITSEPGKPGDLVLSGRFIAPTPRVRMPITWAANNTLLLSQGPEFKVVVVQLEQS